MRLHIPSFTTVFCLSCLQNRMIYRAILHFLNCFMSSRHVFLNIIDPLVLLLPNAMLQQLFFLKDKSPIQLLH